MAMYGMSIQRIPTVTIPQMNSPILNSAKYKTTMHHILIKIIGDQWIIVG